MCFVLGIFLLNGKGAFLIAGYNMMSEEEKKGYDEKGLCGFMGKLMIVLSFSLILIPLGSSFEMDWMVYAGIALPIVIAIGAVIYLNTNNRFRKKV